MGGGSAGQAAQDLCLPALEYLKRCCQILSKMWTMPACPVFNGAQRYNDTDFLKYYSRSWYMWKSISVCNLSFYFRIKTNAVPRCVDPVIPNIDLETFQRPFGAERRLVSASQFISREPTSPVSSPEDSPRPSSPAMPAKVWTCGIINHKKDALF